MTYRIIIEPTAERGIRAGVRWKTENASPTIAARWYNSLLKKIGTLRTVAPSNPAGGVVVTSMP